MPVPPPELLTYEGLAKDRARVIRALHACRDELAAAHARIAELEGRVLLPSREELAARYARHWDYDEINDACVTAAEQALALIQYGDTL